MMTKGLIGLSIATAFLVAGWSDADVHDRAIKHKDYDPISFAGPVTDQYTHIYRGAMIVERVRLFAEDSLRHAIAHALRSITIDDAQGWFQRCGYGHI